VLKQLEEEMWEASEKLEYERAALLRDQIEDWKKAHQLGGVQEARGATVQRTQYTNPKRFNARSKPSRLK